VLLAAIIMTLVACQKSAPPQPAQANSEDWRIILRHELGMAGSVTVAQDLAEIVSDVAGRSQTEAAQYLVEYADEGQEQAAASYGGLMGIGEWDHARLILLTASDPCQLSYRGSPPALDAMHESDQEILAHLLDRGCDPNTMHKNITLLAWALLQDNPDAAKLLYQHGADPDKHEQGHLSARVLADQKGYDIFE
jgi:ankyrin repeat protein